MVPEQGSAALPERQDRDWLWPLTPNCGRKEGVRVAREWLEQQAAAAILTVSSEPADGDPDGCDATANAVKAGVAARCHFEI